MRISVSICLILLTTVSFVSLSKRTQSQKKEKGKAIEYQKEVPKVPSSVIVTNAESSSSSKIIIPPHSAVQVTVKAIKNDEDDPITKEDLKMLSIFDSSARAKRKMRVLWEIEKKHLSTTSRDKGRITDKLKRTDDQMPTNMPNCYYYWVAKNTLKKSKVEQVLRELMKDNYSEEAMEAFYHLQIKIQKEMYGGGRTMNSLRNSALLFLILLGLVATFILQSTIFSWWGSRMK